MSELDIKAYEIDDVTILDLDGAIGPGDSCKDLRDVILTLVKNGKRNVILDLADIRHIDSMGLGSLIVAFTNLRRLGGSLRIINLTEKMQDRFVITKLLTVFDVYETLDAALQAFDGRDVYISCPVHQCDGSIAFGSLASFARCMTCGATLTLESGMSSIGIIEFSTRALRLQTYAEECLTVFPGAPTTIVIDGRLDLFASEVLKKAWLTIPSPRYVLFRLEASSEISPPGVQSLLEFCAEKGSRVMILISLSHLRSVFPADSPVFDNESDAIAAMGKIPPAPKWLATFRR